MGYFRSVMVRSGYADGKVMRLASFPDSQGIRLYCQMMAPVALEEGAIYAPSMSVVIDTFDVPVPTSAPADVLAFAHFPIELGLRVLTEDGKWEYVNVFWVPGGYVDKDGKPIDACFYAEHLAGRRLELSVGNIHETGHSHNKFRSLRAEEGEGSDLIVDGRDITPGMSPLVPEAKQVNVSGYNTRTGCDDHRCAPV